MFSTMLVGAVMSPASVAAVGIMNVSSSLSSLTRVTSAVRRTRQQSRYRSIHHKVKRGESLGSISKKYRINLSQLIRRNRLRRPYRLRIGQKLYIKRVKRKKKQRIIIRASSSRRLRRLSRDRKSKARVRMVKTTRIRTYRHRVRSGETVGSIARGYKVSRRQIIRLNRLRKPYRVRRGRSLIIKQVKTIRYVRSKRKARSKSTVKSKSSHRLTHQANKLRTKNNKKHKNRSSRKSGVSVSARKHIPTKKLLKYKPPKKIIPLRVRTHVHKVRRGDNLRRLSRHYKVSQGQIIRLNRLRHPYRLRPGQRLEIKKVMIRAGHDEFKLGNKSEWKEVKEGKGDSEKIISKRSNSHKYNVNIKKPSTIKGNRLNHLKNKRAASNGTVSQHASRRHIDKSGTSHRSVINRPVKKVGPENGFMLSRGRWIWPANGKLDSRFSRSSKGIKISGQLGQSIYAAAKGKIVYIGDSLIRYGNLVIIKHNSIYFTAYAHNRRLLVQEGQFVSRGQKIAEMGSASSGKIVLHFEIRKDGRPVDPLRYLPRK
ncbi:Murein hydrolase activator NlpD [hydrothermal vent metagenome]|uniref:Murein hydrolase activator NlpD n=1 Tax=hydrothermal vent metagenome TaxID=652676 RepID=A0A3B0Z0N7_9ZZZZ